ncbi:phosphatase PAP2 family protein [Fundidesulfovibrio putealis]|uniref:phosphatase PAP2 family protein n=1 Tax=Fundidesulfovibrio putealis TaxID=270496 RepID=UPI0004139CB5|nr:phosphatase PAP2 family protein [Fundidesulfovibrio putealis]
MRPFAASMAVVVALALPTFCLGQSLGPDAYFSSNAAALQALMLLPQPPAPGTAAQGANMLILNTVMNTATPQMVAQAQADAIPSVFDFSAVLGEDFTAQNLPATTSFFQKVTINTQNANDTLKNIYNSHGPVTPASYPSSHALLGLVDGVLLGDMIPEKQGQLLTYGVQYGLNRLILGQHWPTDVCAAQMETGIFLADLFASPQFQSDFNEAKAELRAQQGLK